MITGFDFSARGLRGHPALDCRKLHIAMFEALKTDDEADNGMQISDSAPGGKRRHQKAKRAVDRRSDGQAGSTRKEGTQNGLKPADVHR